MKPKKCDIAIQKKGQCYIFHTSVQLAILQSRDKNKTSSINSQHSLFPLQDLTGAGTGSTLRSAPPSPRSGCCWWTRRTRATGEPSSSRTSARGVSWRSETDTSSDSRRMMKTASGFWSKAGILYFFRGWGGGVCSLVMKKSA